jgi:vacuolar-type H+-ATPase subunit E/Vma4
MPSTPLLELMTQQVSEQCAQTVAQAEEQAAAIRRAAEEAAAQERAAVLQALEAELSAAATRARERAEAESHMLVMTTKDSVTGEVMDEVQRRLRRIAEGEAFVPILEALLEELLQDAPDEVVVLAPPAHRERTRHWLEQHGRGGVPVEELASLRDGVAVQDPKRTWRVTNTLSSRFAQQEGALRKFCVTRLFGERDGTRKAGGEA